MINNQQRRVVKKLIILITLTLFTNTELLMIKNTPH